MDGIVACALVRLTSDAEKRYLVDGKALLNFSAMALDSSKRSEGQEPEWLRCTVWGEQAEALADRLTKGTECYVEGRLKMNTWTAQDGQQRSGLNLSAWKCEPLGQIGRRRPVAAGNGPAGRRADRDAHRAGAESWLGEAG